MAFDPNDRAAGDSGLFGLPYSVAESKLVLLPVPFEATTSYGGGTANGPQAIFNASKQIDLFDLDLGNFFEAGIAMIDEDAAIKKWNEIAKEAAQKIIKQDNLSDQAIHSLTEVVNSHSEKVNNYVYQETKKYLSAGKQFGLIGGDHSSPFGAIKAFLEYYPDMSILHIDAHADLRKAYEGFEDSHASIMHNVMSKTALKKLVQVGIRDFCEDELDFINENESRIVTFFDVDRVDQKMNGVSFSAISDEIIQHLSRDVYISFDIDGLDPRFCPHTGTPVPGGLDYNEALYLLKKIIRSGRKIIGFDLCEVSPGERNGKDALDTAAEWDANVGARVLYKLCGYLLASV
ncbi:MAG TPA: agmatinase family protein [Gammaproteobacteria bacterium]|nr:agmatinase family protein [Gammaproteobacteria bacterium]